jgi:DNA-binding MarR family transcriptional regulator
MRSITDRTALSEAIIAQLRASFREVRCMSGDRMRRADVSHTHFHIVSMLERHGQMPMSRLADMLDVSLSNASGIIDRLVERGLVERIRVPDDRRVVIVQATDDGRRMLADVEVLKDDMLQQIVSRLDDEQLARAAQALADVQAAALSAFADDPNLGRHDHASDHLSRHGAGHTHQPLDPAAAPAPVVAPSPAS